MKTDPAMGNLGYARVELDWYPTPEWCTRAVLPLLTSRLKRSAIVWEPACGDGAMARVLEEEFDSVIATDLTYRGFGVGGRDFLSMDAPRSTHDVDLICTNPPYGNIAEQFVRKALDHTEERGGIVAMLLRKEYDAASGRVDLFTEKPFRAEIVLTSRPRWIADSKGSPRHNYSWFVWDHQHTGPAQKFYHVRQET